MSKRGVFKLYPHMLMPLPTNHITKSTKSNPYVAPHYYILSRHIAAMCFVVMIYLTLEYLDVLNLSSCREHQKLIKLYIFANFGKP